MNKKISEFENINDCLEMGYNYGNLIILAPISFKEEIEVYKND